MPEDETPEATGHHLFCTEYCGTDHSNMNRKVFVLADEFDKWEEEQARWLDDVPDEDLYSIAGPGSTASARPATPSTAAANTGPSWGDPTSGSMSGLGDIWEEHQVAGTTPVTGGTKGRRTPSSPTTSAREALRDPRGLHPRLDLQPRRAPRRGYGPNMPHFRGQLGDRGIDAVIGMMKNLDQFDNAGKFLRDRGR